VATTPEVVGRLRKLGFDVAVETCAGLDADLTDKSR
jgi:NAD/NADP transhydrogenase alpha subunit